LLFTTGFQTAKEIGKYFDDPFFVQPESFMFWGKHFLLAAGALIRVDDRELNCPPANDVSLQ
jgi:hypothetical protein